MINLYQKTYLARRPPARCVTRRQAGNPPPNIGWTVVTANGGDAGEVVVSLEAGTTGGGRAPAARRVIADKPSGVKVFVVVAAAAAAIAALPPNDISSFFHGLVTVNTLVAAPYQKAWLDY
ncbi:uncharacterized protein CLUP02_08900 [Colletotrichum lupini]|uniref:Uncharacterized protein n=1 Tax=Colletotrichum lupini TaxID=145971 RepID=A0A9Q8WI27_9PEZI|nr:uncharacterized protein CLUP02_08900 [Colletotrichum lupini]UQC83405.1 hypothetical protein CLUP02_08900 [Colletotrichum lupini]